MFEFLGQSEALRLNKTSRVQSFVMNPLDDTAQTLVTSDGKLIVFKFAPPDSENTRVRGTDNRDNSIDGSRNATNAEPKAHAIDASETPESADGNCTLHLSLVNFTGISTVKRPFSITRVVESIGAGIRCMRVSPEKPSNTTFPVSAPLSAPTERVPAAGSDNSDGGVATDAAADASGG